MLSEATASTAYPHGAAAPARHDILPDQKWLDLIEGRSFPLNLADEFAALAALHPQAPMSIATRHAKSAAHHEYKSLTFRRCQQLAEQYARGMHEYGIRRGDTAVILIKPMLDVVPIFLALWRVGAVPVVVDPGAPKAQKLASIAEIGPRVMIGIPSAQTLRLLYPKIFRSIERSVTVGNAWFLGSHTLKSFRQQHRKDTLVSSSPTISPTMADDPMAIVFTSGSTGAPKGVVYTQGNGAAIIQSIKDALDIGPGDRCLACHPAFALYFVGAGATVVTPDLDPRFPRDADPACLLAVIRDQKPTVAFMQIPVIHNLWTYCAARGEKIPHLKKILTTGASVPMDLVQGIQQALAEPGADLHVMYGATEALCVSYATGHDILARAAMTRTGKGTYVGQPSPAVSVKIIGITDQPIEQWSADLVLRPGEIGEVCVFGPVVTPEYRGRPEATKKAKIQDATGIWHRMGDAAYIDGDGALWYCGRIADRVETEHGDLYADLVEPIFNSHPAVLRSALVGLPLADSSRKSPLLLVEPSSADSSLDPAHQQTILADLKALAAQHPLTRAIEDIQIHREPFPVDVRHGAKIRRDLLTSQATQLMRGGKDKLPAEQVVLFKGYRVVYYEKGQGEPLLFLHNAGNDHHIWEHQLAYFSKTCRVVAPDSLGYGKSDHPNLAYSLPLYTEMVATLVDTLALAPVTIVATCTGAAMALNYTLQHPDKVKRLILFHVATEQVVQGGGLERTTRMVSGHPVVTRAMSLLLESLAAAGLPFKGYVRGQYGGQFEEDPDFITHLHGLYGKNGQATSLLNLFSNWKSFAPLDQLTYPATFPPLHVLWGDSNKVLLLERGQDLCERLRPQSFDVIAGGGHLVMRERPEMINQRIEELAQLGQKQQET